VGLLGNDTASPEIWLTTRIGATVSSTKVLTLSAVLRPSLWRAMVLVRV
jgi:hypothetical protein